MRKCLAVAGLAILVGAGWGCQGDDPVNPDGTQKENHAPEIRSLTLDKATIQTGGIIQVSVEAVDADQETITPEYQAQHGIWTRPVDTLWRAQYTHDGSAGSSDTITVTVKDPRNGMATKSQAIVIQPKTP